MLTELGYDAATIKTFHDEKVVKEPRNARMRCVGPTPLCAANRAIGSLARAMGTTALDARSHGHDDRSRWTATIAIRTARVPRAPRVWACLR